MECKVKCKCEKFPIHPPKKMYIIRRMDDGGYQKDSMFFTPEAAMRHVARWKRFYGEHIRDGRHWETGYYLVECEIVEKKLL